MMNTFIRVKSLREQKGWTQTDLAERSGVDQANISRLEAGKTPNASAVLVGQLADALDTTVDYLLGRVDNPSPPPNPDTVSRIERLAADPQFAEIAEAWDEILSDKERGAIHQTVVALAEIVRNRRDGL